MQVVNYDFNMKRYLDSKELRLKNIKNCYKEKKDLV